MIKFSELSNNARIWVYISNRLITPDEKNLILKQGYDFISTWSAHGDKLIASVEIIDNCLLVLGVDEEKTDASGCSIDASISFIKSLENHIQISFFDWQNMVYVENNIIRLIKRNQFEQALKSQKISSDSLIYNNNMKIKSDLTTNKTISISESNFKNLLELKS